MWKKEQVPPEVRKMYIGKGRAKYLFKYAKKHGIEVFFSVFYPEAIDICEDIGVNFYKVRFDDRNNITLFRRLKKTKNKTIFVSCQDPFDTLYFNLAKFQKNVKFLYVIPKYPANIMDYNKVISGHLYYHFQGISDHTPDIELFKYFNTIKEECWFEIHVKENNNCFETKWSKSFTKLKEAL